MTNKNMNTMTKTATENTATTNTTTNKTAKTTIPTTQAAIKTPKTINDGIRFAKSTGFRQELAEHALWSFNRGSAAPWIRPLEFGDKNRIWLIYFWGKKPRNHQAMIKLVEKMISQEIDLQCDSKATTRRLQNRVKLENLTIAHGDIAGRDILVVQLRED